MVNTRDTLKSADLQDFIDEVLVESARDPEAETIRIDRPRAVKAAKWIENRLEGIAKGGRNSAGTFKPRMNTLKAKVEREKKRRYREKKKAR